MQKMKKVLAILLTLSMVLSYVPVPALAEDGTCEHHVHDEACGYAAQGVCSYSCDQCGQEESACTGLSDCPAEAHGDTCAKKLADDQTAAEEAAKLAAEQAAAEEAAKLAAEQAAAEATAKLAAEQAAAEEAARLAAEQEAAEKAAADQAAADAVAALINALPTLESLQAKPVEEQTNDYNQVQSAYEGYGKLTEEQKKLLPSAEDVFKPYFDYFNSLTTEIEETETTGGTCGKNLTWSFDENSRTLTISGTGAMENFSSSEKVPWKSLNDVKTVIIGNGVTSIGSYAFYNFSNMTSVSIPVSVTSIGREAFYNCSNLSSVAIPYRNTSIGDSAFSGCNGLKNIYYSGTWKHWDENGYSYVEGLSYVEIHVSYFCESGHSYGSDHICIYCGSVDGVCGENLTYTLNDAGVLTISGIGDMDDYLDGAKAPWHKPSDIKTIIIEDGVTSIGSSAFADCSNVTSVIIPDSVTTIGGSAFSGCSGLASMTIPDSVTSIGSWLFYNCTALKEVVIEGTETTIGEAIFARCPVLERITIPSAGKSIGRMQYMFGYYFYGTDWGDVLGDGYVAVTQPAYDTTINSGGNANRIYSIPETLRHITINANTINDGAFTGFKMLESISFGKNVKKIYGRPFHECKNLKYLDFYGDAPATLTSTYSTGGMFTWMKITVYYPRNNSTWSTMITKQFDGTVTWVEKECVGITHVGTPIQENVIPADCENDGYYEEVLICSICSSVTRTPKVIPAIGHTEVVDSGYAQTCTTIGITEGKHCSVCQKILLEQQRIPFHLYSAGTCTKCGQAEPQDSGICGENLVWMISADGRLSFEGSGAMDSYETVPWDVYRNNITEVHLADGITHISKSAFANCKNLTKVIIPDSVTSIGEGVFSSSGVKEVVWGISLTEIPEKAFYDCEALESMVIPEGILKIGKSAFYGCDSLKEITLPSSLTTIEDSAFCYCVQLNSLVIPEGVENIGELAFGECAGITQITFLGNAPNFDGRMFSNSNIEVFYSAKKNGWTAAIRDALGSNIRWIALECQDGHTVAIAPAITPSCKQIGLTQGSYCSICNQILLKQEILPYEHNYKNGICTLCGESSAFQGSCGMNVYWKLEDNCVLHIYGNGAMSNYWLNQPWLEYQDEIRMVVVDDGVTSIGEAAFAQFEKLNCVILGNSVATIERMAFYNCTSLESVSMPNSLQFIEDDAFRGCSRLLNVVIPNNVTNIGSRAFFACERLKYVTFGEAVTNIGASAFQNCTDLLEVKFLGDPPSAESLAFSMTGATAYYPGNNPKWTQSAMNAIDTLYLSWISYNTNSVLGCTSHLTVIATAEIPSTCIQRGYSAMTYCSRCGIILSQRELLPYGEHTEKLISGKEPTCTAIGLSSGKVCEVCETTIVEQEEIPAYGHDYDSDYICRRCSANGRTCGENLTWNLAEDGTLTISGEGSMAMILGKEKQPWYASSEQIKKVVVGEGVTSISQEAFMECPNLEEVIISDTVEEIGALAFYSCESLRSVALPGELEALEMNLFANCNSLTSLTLPETLKSIGSQVFMGSGLTEITIPASVESIGGLAFADCDSLKKVYFEGDPPAIHIGDAGQAGSFDKCILTAYYPAGNENWTENVMQGYDGEITWEPYGNSVIPGNNLYLEDAALSNETTVWIDGIPYPVQKDNSGKVYVELPEGAEVTNMVIYGFHVGDPNDVHTQYPVSMKVWMLQKDENGIYQAHYVKELDNILQYSGSSIRITGNKGIRMITSVPKNKKDALTGAGLAGYKLVEYGTVLSWASDLADGAPLVLGESYAKHNYAYKRGVADPVFAYSGNLVQYTNVLVGFNRDQCKEDIAMRPYMILEDAAGKQVTIYGGTVYRSIGYIAYQNRGVFAPGSAAYNYVWEIIHHVYGDKYDADYKG